MFVDEDVNTLASLSAQFKTTHTVLTANTVDELFHVLSNNSIHVVVCSQRMTTHTGVELLREVKHVSPSTVRILLTGYADLAMIVGSIEEDDIYSYITKPWQPEALQRTIASATKQALEVHLSQSGVYRAVIPPAEKILVIDDCDETHDLLLTQFTGAYDVCHAKNIDQVVDLIANHEFGVIISDIKLNGVDITPLISTFKERMPHTFTVLLTRLQETDRLVELISQRKVYRCLPKPIRPSLIEMSVQRAFSKYRHMKSYVEPVYDETVEVEDASIKKIQQYLAEIKQKQAQALTQNDMSDQSLPNL